MSWLSHLSECPWKRTTARSAVAASTGGTDDGCPCGMSTQTYGTAYDVRKSRVSAALSADNHVLLRNSTHMRSGSHRRLHSRMYCLFRLPIGNHWGNWKSTAPSLPASSNGVSADRNRSHTASTAVGSRSLR